MIDLTLDMEQYDCPFIAATEAQPVSFSAVNWEFEGGREGWLETRMLVEGDDDGAVEAGLDVLRGHDGLRECGLISKQDDVAHIRTVIDETAAMRTIRDHDGYITGPFHIEAGSELWHVGFDHDSTAEQALAGLERENEFEVVARDPVNETEVTGFAENVGAAMTLIQGCQDLTDTERETLEAAVERGYFRSPRGATLGDLADEFGVSKPAVSKRLRRGQEKAVSRMVEAMDELDG
ncbi:helix-turn-helix domain-containing protein [Haloglomus halophilum]|uniref:helix-turn-helix domain-containing protein n=1 Tax=Haloglomus halophilum TaxID=2962672 RepID=UPI0020C9A0B9|nr:helix-turn-helix domain-containing protein [Haloglomus halophilum]